MASDKPGGRVLLSGQLSASAVLHGVLRDTARAYPEALARTGLPDQPDVFRRSYPDRLPHFEAARLAAPGRREIARTAIDELRRHLVWESPAGAAPLSELLSEPVEPLPLEVEKFTGDPGWEPGLLYRGARWSSERFADLGHDLAERGMATAASGDAPFP